MSSHVVTLRNAILEARAVLTSYADLTALVPVAQITYGNSPQKDVMPRIVIEASGTEYDATFMASRKVQTFTLDYAVYSDSVDACTNIMDKMRDALDIYDSSEFSIRVTDESFQAEVDGTLVGVVVATFQDADGAPGFGAGLSALNDLTVVQAALDAAQAELAAETAQWETATGGTYDDYINPPAFNAAGALGEDSTAIWSLRRIADGYTGPLLQIADANTVNGTNDGWTDVRDIDETEFKLHYISDVGDTNAGSSEDGIEWIVTRIYDQVGSNDLVFDAQEVKDVTGSWPTFGPRLWFHNGAWGVSTARNPYGFATANEVRYDNFMAAIDFSTGSGARHQVFGGADNPLNAPYPYFGMTAWNSTTDSTKMWVGNGASTSGSDYMTITDAALTDVHVNGGRRTMALSREPGQASSFDGAVINTASVNAERDPAVGSTVKIGWGTDNYNTNASSDDVFYGAVYMSGVYKDAATVKAIAEDLALNRIGYRLLSAASNG